MFTYVMDLLLAAMAVCMFFGGKYGITRQAAFLPLVIGAVDAVFAGQITLSLTPVLSALLIALQAIVLLGSGLMLQQDRAHAKAKSARRRRRRELAASRAAFEQALEERHGTVTRRRVCA